ncbi:MAG: RND transporter [Desulfobulbaceae bacterium]|uniref:RND transporter n=1 Tax=Candidatus Desulfatifera sulfidica TaxID=2841691 RepID=A0A8J6N8C3_9BACT|nr:RND transporter [Candidatus Desulfatifera sulfidica]
MRFIDSLSWPILLSMSLLLGLAPYVPEPHIIEKLRMLTQGTLHRPLDIFDLCYHAAPFFVVIIKLQRTFKRKT